MIIYPKVNESLQGLNNLKKYVEKYKGLEIQLLSMEQTNENTYKSIKKLKNEIPNIEEVTIHLPLRDEVTFETYAFSKLDQEKERLEKLIDISNEYNLRINLLYHTRWNYNSWHNSGAVEKMKELLDIIKNSNVFILIENMYAIVERKECTVLKVAKEIDNVHLRVCIDVCHIHVEANMYREPISEYINKYLNKEDCEKYVHQIHFAGTLDEDGYIDEKTHGRLHDSWVSFEEDYNFLKQFGIKDKIIVTEISEEDYSTRKDEIKEIEMLIRKGQEE